LDSEEQIFTISLDEARAIYAQPKQRGRTVAKPPLADLGPDPVSGRPMVIKEGRFGAYVTDGEVNATLRRGDDPTTMTSERAAELLAEKRAKGPATRKRPAKKAAAKKAATTNGSAPVKKAPAKKAAVKKAAAKKTSARAR
jgi:DNA topoisomerase I